MARNDVGLKVMRGVANNGLVPFSDPSKRNIGLIMTRERGAENVPTLFSSLADDRLKFGDIMAGSYAAILTRNLFRNANDSNVTCYGVRVVGAGSVPASSSLTINVTPSVTLQVIAGQMGAIDKGTWGNNLSVRFYFYGLKEKGKWVLEVYYKNQLVETWSDALCMTMQTTINTSSNYIIANFSAEPVIPTGTSTLVPGTNNGVGTITTTTAGSPETLATATITFTVVGSTGATVGAFVNGILIGSYTQLAGDTITNLATGLAANINLGATGFTATSALGVVTVSSPVGSGATYNTIAFTINKTGTVQITNTATAFAGGVNAIPPGTVNTVTGVGTNFTIVTHPVGSVLLSATGQYIGTVSAVTSTTVITLTANAAVPLNTQPFLYCSFYSVVSNLAGGVYVAPSEPDFYPIQSPTNPKGLACFDGTDIQILVNTEFHTLTMAQQMKAYCESRKDCMAVINLPYLPTDTVIQSFASALQGNTESFISGYNAWVKTADANNNYVWVPSLGCVLGAGYIRVPYMNGDFVHIAPGGIESSFNDIIDVVPNKLSTTQLNRYTRDFTVNTVAFQKGKGFFLMTSRTYSTNPLYHSVHILMQTNYYVKALADSLTWTLQKPNTPELKKQIYTSCYAFFKTEYGNGALERSVPFEEACIIICDQSNNPATQDRKDLNVDILWIPTDVAEAVKISLNRNDSSLVVKAIFNN